MNDISGRNTSSSTIPPQSKIKLFSFPVIILIVALIVIAIGGFYFSSSYQQKKRQPGGVMTIVPAELVEESSIEVEAVPEDPAGTLDLKTVQVGDRFGVWTVKENTIKPKTIMDFDGNKRTGLHGLIKFDGSLIISGEYVVNELQGGVVFYPDNQYLEKLPKILGSNVGDVPGYASAAFHISFFDGIKGVLPKRGEKARATILLTNLDWREVFTVVGDVAWGFSGDNIPINPNNLKVARGDYEIKTFEDFIQTDFNVDANEQGLLIHNPAAFEGERGAGRLALIDGKTKTINTIEDVLGASFLPDDKTVLLSKFFDVDLRKGLLEFDMQKVAKVIEETGVTEQAILANVYKYGGRPALGVAILFELDLETSEEKSLKLFGGQGGILRHAWYDDVYISNRPTLTYVTDTNIKREHGIGLFGGRPYYRYGYRTSTLTLMPNDFMPTAGFVGDPYSAFPKAFFRSKSYKPIRQTEFITLATWDNRFWLSFR